MGSAAVPRSRRSASPCSADWDRSVARLHEKACNKSSTVARVDVCRPVSKRSSLCRCGSSSASKLAPSSLNEYYEMPCRGILSQHGRMQTMIMLKKVETVNSDGARKLRTNAKDPRGLVILRSRSSDQRQTGERCTQHVAKSER